MAGIVRGSRRVENERPQKVTGGLGDESYSDCLDAADPNDSAAIAACRALLP